MEPMIYRYSTALKWIGEKKGILRSNNKIDLEVACPPEFGGHKNIWSPEDMFLASVEVCTMTTFLFFSKKTDTTFSSYESNAEGIVKMVDNSFQFDSIRIFIKIQVESEKDKKKVERIFKHITKTCLISNSIKPSVTYETKIDIRSLSEE
ncbi:MAG: OsmC family protein [Candidatus Thermoplasmatota archaeon]|nr:OsmC family protein [Candidatus Thermoplasmatota archaeon]